MSNEEKLLNALINGEDVSEFNCKSRMEHLLKQCCMKESCDDITPRSRVEYLLKELNKVVCEGGGSSGGSSIPEGYIKPTGTIEITENGTHDVTQYASANVNVASGGEDRLPIFLTARGGNYLFYNWDDTKNDKVSFNDTKDMTTLNFGFANSYQMTTHPNINLENLTSASNCFNNCNKLIEINLPTTKKVTGFSDFINNCSVLEKITIDCRSATNVTNTFTRASLKYVCAIGIKISFSISSSTKFTASDLVTTMSNCQVITTTQTLTMGSTNLAKLDGVYVKETGVEPYEGITVRPCVICESTDEGAMLATDYFTGKGWTLA